MVGYPLSTARLPAKPGALYSCERRDSISQFAVFSKGFWTFDALRTGDWPCRALRMVCQTTRLELSWMAISVGDGFSGCAGPTAPRGCDDEADRGPGDGSARPNGCDLLISRHSAYAPARNMPAREAARMTIADGLTERIHGVRYDTLPEDALHWARVAILDNVGVTLAGASEPCARIAARVLTGGGSTRCRGSPG